MNISIIPVVNLAAECVKIDRVGGLDAGFLQVPLVNSGFTGPIIAWVYKRDEILSLAVRQYLIKMLT